MSHSPRPEVLAFLADVKENPEDLTPWLVLCDWLEENGDEADRARSEYCRLCFDKLGKKTYASDWEKGERRRELFRQYSERWLGPILQLQPMRVKGLFRIEWWRLLNDLLLPLLEHEENWAWVYSLSLRATGNHLENPNFSRLFSYLTELFLRDVQGDAALRALANCPGLAQLRYLSLHGTKFTLAGVRALTRSPYLDCLNRLVISSPRLKPDARALLQDRFGAALEVYH